MNFWVIEKDQTDENLHLVKGPFGNKEAAKKWIIEDCKASFACADDVLIGENNDWSGPLMILQEVETVKPIPVVTFTIKT
jgi:hypothetical protein